MSAPGALARRFRGDASANYMPATSLRKHSTPNTTARHCTLRRAMASAAAKMPRKQCILSGGFLNEMMSRDADIRCRQAALQGASEATHPHITCPQHRCAITRRLIRWHVTELLGGRWRRRRRRRVIWGFICGALSRSPDHECPYI